MQAVELPGPSHVQGPVSKPIVLSALITSYLYYIVCFCFDKIVFWWLCPNSGTPSQQRSNLQLLQHFVLVLQINPVLFIRVLGGLCIYCIICLPLFQCGRVIRLAYQPLTVVYFIHFMLLMMQEIQISSVLMVCNKESVNTYCRPSVFNVDILSLEYDSKEKLNECSLKTPAVEVGQ